MIKDLPIQLLLADDDIDDCDLFKEALGELPVTTRLETVHNGEQLMQLLIDKKAVFPQLLFLDLNMPKKNGFECLTEIKRNEKLQHIPVIIISTSFDKDIVNLLFTNGAHYYISKPNEFEKLKNVIQVALFAISNGSLAKPDRENFVLQF